MAKEKKERPRSRIKSKPKEDQPIKRRTSAVEKRAERASKKPDSKARPKESSKDEPKKTSRPKSESKQEAPKNLPPIPTKIHCECGFTFSKIVQETYGSFLCPKCKKTTSLEVQEKLVLNNKNITIVVAAFVLCFLLYFGVEALMGKLNENKPTTFQLTNKDNQTILEIFPTEDQD